MDDCLELYIVFKFVIVVFAVSHWIFLVDLDINRDDAVGSMLVGIVLITYNSVSPAGCWFQRIYASRL